MGPTPNDRADEPRNADVGVSRLRTVCRGNKLSAFGTAYIFGRRAHDLRIKIQFLTFLGLVIPVAVGAIIIAFGSNASFLHQTLWVAGVLGIVQAVISAWSLVVGWTDAYSYAQDAAIANNRISNQYEALLAEGELPDDEFLRRYELLTVEDEARTAQDLTWDITEKERRRGTRAALRQFKIKCVQCGKIPRSMKSTNCDVCGNFRPFWPGG